MGASTSEAESTSAATAAAEDDGGAVEAAGRGRRRLAPRTGIICLMNADVLGVIRCLDNRFGPRGGDIGRDEYGEVGLVENGDVARGGAA